MKKFEHFLTEARGRFYPEDCKTGMKYTVGYRNNTWDATFIGWEIKDEKPRMKWEDDEIGEWDAYMFEGRMCVGSSADELKIISRA